MSENSILPKHQTGKRRKWDHLFVGWGMAMLRKDRFEERDLFASSHILFDPVTVARPVKTVTRITSCLEELEILQT